MPNCTNVQNGTKIQLKGIVIDLLRPVLYVTNKVPGIIHATGNMNFAKKKQNVKRSLHRAN